MKFLPKPKKLNGRGISHIILPLLVVVAVGVVGTYLIVGSHALTPKPDKPKNNFSELVVFSQNGDYDYADVSVVGGNPANYTCGGSFKATNAFNETNSILVPIKQPTKTNKVGFTALKKCTPISGSAYYHVEFGSKTSSKPLVVDFAKPGVNVNVDAGYCTFVHANGTVHLKINDGKGCNGAADPDQAQAPKTPTTRVIGLAVKSQNTITGYVDVTPTPADIPAANIKSTQRDRCTGTVEIVAKTAGTTLVNGVSTPVHTVTNTVPLKWTADKSNTHHGNGYCAATISSRIGTGKGDWAGDWTVTATLKSSNYFALGTDAASAQGAIKVTP